MGAGDPPGWDGVIMRTMDDARRRGKEKARARAGARRQKLPLSDAQVIDLADHLEAVLAARPCDHSLCETAAWADAQGLRIEVLRPGLEEYGGYCDCEVRDNVGGAEFLP